MEVCKSDIQAIERLLYQSATIIERYCVKPCELDKARLCRKMIKKLKRKKENE